LIKELAAHVHIDIYIHTWTVVQSNMSWRALKQDNTPVTQETIVTYFDDLAPLIKHIIIEDDSNIVLNGNLEGRVGSSRAPLLGWKRYWYGQYHMMQYIAANMKDDDAILNMRFDVLENSCSLLPEHIVNFVTALDPPFTKNVFMKHEEFAGCDNVYAGSVNTMLALITHFHENLDSILELEHRIQYQEYLVMRENDAIFDSSSFIRHLSPGVGVTFSGLPISYYCSVEPFGDRAEAIRARSWLDDIHALVLMIKEGLGGICSCGRMLI